MMGHVQSVAVCFYKDQEQLKRIAVLSVGPSHVVQGATRHSFYPAE